jgi:hypothetical protein
MSRYIFAGIFAAMIFAAMIPLACNKGGSSVPTSPDSPREMTTAFIDIGDTSIEGDTLSVTVDYENALDIYALSFRMGYNPGQLSPVDVTWDEIVSSDDSTFDLLNQHGFVPLAFGKFDGNAGISGNGNLVTVKFNILDGNYESPWIINETEYLVGKDSTGSRINIMTGGDVL